MTAHCRQLKLAGLGQQRFSTGSNPLWKRHRTIVLRINASEASPGTPAPTSSQQHLVDIWEEQMKWNFVTKNVEEIEVTMIEGAVTNHVPTMTGGVGLEAIRAFKSNHFIYNMPPDVETVLVSRTIGSTQIVDEMIFKFTHTVDMDWMLPGVVPTGRRVEVGLVAVAGFRDGKICHERVYWDQASVLAQVGLLDATSGPLPIAGVESARKIEDPMAFPSNTLIQRLVDGSS